jgi:translocation and assembly module TamA
VRAASGPLFRSGEIEIEGLQRQDRETVLNLANFKRGTRVTETLLLDFQDRLQKSGLFEGVSVTLDADPAHAVAAPVRVKLTEAALHQVIAGFGVSATTGPRATLEHVWRRVFDRAITARNKLEWGRDRQAWDGEASTHPDDDLYRWVLGVTIERLKSDSDVVLSQSVRAGRAQDTPRIDRFHFAEFVRASRRTGTTRTDASALSLNVHWTWRDIDSPILPTDGVTLSLQGGLGQARGDAGTHSGFGRAWGRITFYKPLGRQWYGQARFEAGQVFVRTGLDVPETLRFRAGGDESVRGYAYRSLGPLVEGEVGSGDVVATASVELARPVSAALPSVWGAVFVDAGNAADSFGHLNPVLGTGVGVRWRSPVGPLKLDWAYGREVHRSRLHFSVGIVF